MKCPHCAQTLNTTSSSPSEVCMSKKIYYLAVEMGFFLDKDGKRITSSVRSAYPFQSFEEADEAGRAFTRNKKWWCVLAPNSL